MFNLHCSFTSVALFPVKRAGLLLLLVLLWSLLFLIN